ncbi:MAG: FHA domain-containing protein [Lentisphaerae bacterium]|jgi:pSer/pThr/pTyr-binding forkhead associated (FHA) protein|nr:FHA domain-containing protein [Lentisphaerota bacterium]
MATAKILILSEQMRGASFSLTNEQYTIGRSESADICIADPTISGHHCTLIQQAPGSFAVRDEGSTNGTRVNGEKVETDIVPLNNGDILQVGGVEILYDNSEERRSDIRATTVINLEETGTVDVSVTAMKNLAGRSKMRRSGALRENKKHTTLFIVLISLLSIAVLILLGYALLKMK